MHQCTINSKINGTPKAVYLPTSKFHSVLAVANLFAHNNFWLSYHGQINSLLLVKLSWANKFATANLKCSVASKWARKHLWGTIYYAVDGT